MIPLQAEFLQDRNIPFCAKRAKFFAFFAHHQGLNGTMFGTAYSPCRFAQPKSDRE
jgi:hypothetical protein